ncbi:SsgA family sporulation/cell division regulator [Amycolatopsis minnesotensis]|uniref:SsgA family sporulation/cell division regulator n=1 Tax=Amycolatopsis minnesotensis TaxID=337894 RepID=A0ABP5DVE8_9PSEU
MLVSFDPPDPEVDIEMTARLNGRTEIGARFLYSLDNPYAVTFLLNPGSDEREWRFARDLLAEGMNRAAGDGDVRIGPDGDVVRIGLYSPTGAAVLYFGRADLEKALEATEVLVPPGEESEFWDWDTEWVRFIGDAA